MGARDLLMRSFLRSSGLVAPAVAAARPVHPQHHIAHCTAHSPQLPVRRRDSPASCHALSTFCAFPVVRPDFFSSCGSQGSHGHGMAEIQLADVSVPIRSQIARPLASLILSTFSSVGGGLEAAARTCLAACLAPLPGLHTRSCPVLCILMTPCCTQ
jgi:hypothetical protein